jgi:Flp pilus assembly protein TadG
MNTNKRKSSLRQKRSGAVVTEFALCLPILLLFFFASLEFARVNMIRQSVENAVYEGTRRGIVPGATADNCRDAAQVVLNSIAAVDAVVDVDPSTITDDTEDITVSIDVPINSNSWVAPFFFNGKTVSSSMTLRRERFNNARVP